jgi:hypothetical protein
VNGISFGFPKSREAGDVVASGSPRRQILYPNWAAILMNKAAVFYLARLAEGFDALATEDGDVIPLSFPVVECEWFPGCAPLNRECASPHRAGVFVAMGAGSFP